jgi:23S rRNA pseudouridine2605 synthase
MAKNTSKVDAETEGDAGAAGKERLHKFLASTGAGSRRESETFITQGRVTVNGKVVTKMGVKVDPARDEVTLDGERVKPQALVYYLLNKPMGYICTNSDERGRPRVVDLVKENRRIYTVGRLDAESTGLILLTNDGKIANVVCHPRYRIEKRYQVIVRGQITRGQLTRVAAGVWLAEGKASPARIKPIGYNPKRNETVLEVVLFEGRNREIRRVFARVGMQVRRLRRTHIGPLALGEMPPGSYAKLAPEDLAFVDNSERLYLANREAWDAELPPERPAGRPARGRKANDGPRRRRSGGGRRGDGASGGGGGWDANAPLPRRGHRRASGGPASSSSAPGRRRRRPYGG